MEHIRRFRVLKKSQKKPSKLVRYGAIVLVALMVLSAVLYFLPGPAKAQDDYTFGTELVNKGYSTNPTGKNIEDGTYNQLQEGDQYVDTNLSGSSENIVVGTTGGGTFPSALDTDDATRRNYIEASSGGSPTYQVIRPNADGSSITMITFPVSPTTHYTKVNEVTKDDETSYNAGVATGGGEKDIYGMTDPSDPGGTPNIDVNMWIYARGVTATQCSLTYGIDIAGTPYAGGTPLITTMTYTNYSYTWTINPSTSAEWTFAQLASLNTYLLGVDGNPDTHTTQVALLITFTPTASYTLDAQITYSSVASTSQTTGFQVLCQGYRTGDTESVNVQAWNYTSSAWVTKVTISAGSDTDYNFNLLGWAANCERSSGNVVLLRLVDASAGDATQTTAFLDVLKVQRIEQGYWLNVELTSTSVAQYGNITLRIKGYTSAESFHIDVWNYTSGAYDTNKLTISSLSNTWQTTLDLVDSAARSTQTVKIRIMDDTNYTADVVADTLYLDVAWITRYHTDPTLTLYGALPLIIGSGQAISFFANYSDYDNAAPTIIYVNIDTSDFSLTKNDTGDNAYWNGVNYSLSKSDLSLGEHTYYFRTQDVASGVVTTASAKVYINATPALSADTVYPATGNVGETFNFTVAFNDTNGDMPTYMKATIDSVDYTMLQVDAGDTNTVDGKAYYYNKVMSGGPHTYKFKTKDAYSPEILTTQKNLQVNNIPVLNGFGRTPADPVYVTTQLNFTCTFTDADNDLPSAIKWRENGGAVQNLSMTQIDPYDVTTTDGKAYFIWVYLNHGTHNYDYWASDGAVGTSGGSNSVTIQNRAPTIDNKFVDDHEWRNTYWSWDYAYTDLDGDTVVFQMSTNATFLNINSASGLVDGTTSDPVGWYSTTVWCNDSYSGTDNDVFILYVDNRVPVITNGPAAHVDQWRNQAWYYDFDYSDADGDSMNWARSGPSWLTIAADGNLSGTTSDTPGLYTFTVYANDSYGGSDSHAFDIHITNRDPVISNGPGASVNEWRNTFWQYDFDATDPDTDTISWGRSGATWVTIDSNGLLSGTTTNTPGDYPITVYANDSYGGQDTYAFTLHILNRAPSITDTCGSTPSAYRNVAWSFDFNATDPDTDTLTWARSGASWLTIDSGTGVLSGTTTDTPGNYLYTVYANDSYGGSANFAFTLTIANRAPTITDKCSSNPTAYRNVAWSFDFNYSDADGDSVAWARSGASWLNMDSGTGVLSGTTTNAPGDYVFTVYANDSYGGSANYQFTLSIVNRVPSITNGPTDPSTYRNILWYYDFTFNDPDGDTMSWAKSGPAWLSIGSDGNLSGTTTNTPGSYSVTVWANDSYGGSDSYAFTLYIVNRNPEITSNPGDPSTWRNTFWWWDFTASDPDTDSISWAKTGPAWLTISGTGNLSGTAPDAPGDYGFVVYANDSYGGSANYPFTLHVVNAGLTITNGPGADPATYRNTFWWYDFTATDDPTWAYQGPAWLSINPATGNLSGTTDDVVGTYLCHVWANDTYGASDEYNFTLHVNNRNPSITDHPNNPTNLYRNVYWSYDFNFSDADGDSVSWATNGVAWLTIDASGILSGTTTNTPGAYSINVWANDSYGGSANYQFTLNINNQIPQITSSGNTTQVEGTYMAYHVTATDPDGDGLTLGFSTNASWLSMSGWWINGTATGIGWYQCTIWVNDSYGGSVQNFWQVQVLTAGNQPPTFTTAPVTTGEHPWNYYYDVNASDPELDPLTFDILTGCSYLNIDHSTGVISGLIPIAGTWFLNISVTDGTSTVWQNFSITSTNTPPTFTSVQVTEWQHGTSYYYDANYNDDNGDTCTFALAGNCTAFLTIIPGTGVISGVVPSMGWWNVEISLSDFNSTTWQNFTLTGLNTAPTFTSSGITEWQNGTLYSYDANANDVNFDSLVFSVEGNSTVFLSIIPGSGLITGTLPIMGWWYVNVSVSDSWSTTWQNFTLYALNTAPTITTSPILTGAPGVNYVYNADATDVNSDTLQWAATEKPIWMVVDPNTGECTGMPVIDGSYDVKLVVFDGIAYSWQNWTIVVTTPSEPPATPPADNPTPSDTNPTASFKYTVVNNKVVLEDTSHGTVTKLQWSFGDGTGSQDGKVTHTYLSPGNYTITLTVWNGQYSSGASIILHIGPADVWRLEKGEATYKVSTPYGSFEWNAAISAILGVVLLVSSFGGQKFPILKSKYVRGLGIVLLVIGAAFYVL